MYVYREKTKRTTRILSPWEADLVKAPLSLKALMALVVSCDRYVNSHFSRELKKEEEWNERKAAC